MTDLTQLSISMAVYNSEGFIRERLESFGRQTHLSDELVVNVNPSTDETVKSIYHFAKGDLLLDDHK